MFAIKPISRDSVTAALAKAERYRLLNEPHEAESICRDILDVDPQNAQAQITLVLALTDLIPSDGQAFASALSIASHLASPYDRAYYTGIAWERRAKARHDGAGQGARQYVYEWIVNALKFFEEAEKSRAPGNDDAVLRWNACVRFLALKQLSPQPQETPEPIISE